MLPSRLLIVRQNFPDLRLADVRAEARHQLERGGFAARLQPGARVAIGVGSRGIANISVIVRSVVDYWQAHGMSPFVFPAMGSHGAATPEGQADVLAQFGITERSIGCPVVSRADVVSLGQTADGIEVFMDAAAHAADGVMIVPRVKWHTTFDGRLESGLMKMMAIGLGKFAGAQNYHAHAKRLGLEHVIRTVGRRVLASGKMIGGLAILEDSHHNTARLDAVPADAMERRDEEHLVLAKSWMPRLPCDLDVLIVDEMGKNISGTGMDAKVVNRGPSGEYNPWPGLPAIGRIFVRSLAAETHGNAMGIGMADVTSERLVRQIDWDPTRINALSAGVPSRIRVPATFASDRACLEWVAATAGKLDPAAVTFGWIRNTLELSRLAVSPNLRAQIDGQPLVDVEAEVDLQWDDSGNLLSPFAMDEERSPLPIRMPEADATPPSAAPAGAGSAVAPAAIADGVLRQLDPNTIRVDRIASWIFTSVVGVVLLIQLVVNLFGGPWRIALGVALTLGVGGCLVWVSHRWPEISYRHTFYRVDPHGIEIRSGVVWRGTTYVPKSRVQHTDVSQGPLERKYALGTLIVYTAGTDHAKVELPGLSHARALRIRDHLLPSGGDDAV